MDTSSQKSANGSAPSMVSPNTQTNRALLSTHSIFGYTTSITRGDAPVSTLLQHGNIDSRLTTRKTKVQREVNDAMAKLSQASTKYAPFPYSTKVPRTAYHRELNSQRPKGRIHHSRSIMA
ncbi:hypothetical protein F4781DRAFT_17881 [Annulohypoxylon bovei var. microspora]|nr:hypothetical protein F4781DRAFT_17881 [Annulohypoxylon bovei var. microspora]